MAKIGDRNEPQEEATICGNAPLTSCQLDPGSCVTVRWRLAFALRLGLGLTLGLALPCIEDEGKTDDEGDRRPATGLGEAVRELP
jgi:hypothetical protein